MLFPCFMILRFLAVSSSLPCLTLRCQIRALCLDLCQAAGTLLCLATALPTYVGPQSNVYPPMTTKANIAAQLNVRACPPSCSHHPWTGWSFCRHRTATDPTHWSDLWSHRSQSSSSITPYQATVEKSEVCQHTTSITTTLACTQQDPASKSPENGCHSSQLKF